ncbi:MAG TPA: MFS transporter [Thermoanaerobaculia bacterium]|nr:MFS transporter [Thermoanaerobaculia bacterium]
MSNETSPPKNMRVFLLIWFGQFISAIGTGLGSFTLGVWIYETTGSATQFSLMAFVGILPALLLSPLAGAFADRYDRRRIMLATDLLAAIMTGLLVLALYTGRLETWHVYPFVMAMVTLAMFQAPAFLASVSLLVPREQLARANGMSQMSQSVAQILGPLLAGVLVRFISYHGVILIDCITFLVGAATLALVRIPRSAPAAAEPRPGGAAAGAPASVSGWQYLRTHSGLLNLMILFALTNFGVGIVQVMLTPLVLSFASTVELGTVNSAAAAGSLLGGIALSVWGGPRYRVGAILACLAAQALLLFVGGARPSIPLIATAAAMFMLTVPIMNGCSQAIWQSKVPHNLQGRVFAVRQMITLSALPLAYLISGPLADLVFNPLLVPGGALADSVGRFLGVGEGRGVGLLLMALGAFILLVTALFSFNPRLRRVEAEVPDAEAAPAPPEPGSAVAPEAQTA